MSAKNTRQEKILEKIITNQGINAVPPVRFLLIGMVPIVHAVELYCE